MAGNCVSAGQRWFPRLVRGPLRRSPEAPKPPLTCGNAPPPRTHARAHTHARAPTRAHARARDGSLLLGNTINLITNNCPYPDNRKGFSEPAEKNFSSTGILASDYLLFSISYPLTPITVSSLARLARVRTRACARRGWFCKIFVNFAKEN